MTPTWAEIYDLVRVRLGDDDTPGGQIFTDAYLASHAKAAAEDVFRAFSRYRIPYVERETFVRVAPYTSYVDMNASGINGGNTVSQIWSKEPEFISEVPLTPAPSNDPATGFVQLQPLDISGLATGDTVEVILDRRFYGVVNDVWTITVNSPFIILNGCLAAIRPSADYTGALPGYMSKGGGWRELGGPDSNWNPEDRGGQGTGTTSRWAVRGGGLRLWPASSTAQVLSVRYAVTGDYDQDTPDAVTQLDDSLTLYSTIIAGKAAQSKGQPNAEIFLAEAYGPTMQPTGEGGILGGIIDRMILGMQMAPRIKGRFTPRNWNRYFVGGQSRRIRRY